jgi:hypothetical protein
LIELIYQIKKGGQKVARPRAAECSNCHGTNQKCHYLKSGRKCRKGKAIGKANSKLLDKQADYDGLIADMFNDYQIALDNQIINFQKGNITRDEIKVYSFYRFLKTKNNALAEYYRTHNYNLTSEIYVQLYKLK